jgi:hypothetical protein
VKIWDKETIELNGVAVRDRSFSCFKESFFENHLNTVDRRHIINKETVEGAAGVYYDEYIVKVRFVSCGVVFEPCASRVRGHGYIVQKLLVLAEQRGRTSRSITSRLHVNLAGDSGRCVHCGVLAGVMD